MKKATGINYIAYFVGLSWIIGMTSCSKKVVYTAPVALSQDYISSLSYEKQMAYKFVIASKIENIIADTDLSDSFYSHDQNWGGERTAI